MGLRAGAGRDQGALGRACGRTNVRLYTRCVALSCAVVRTSTGVYTASRRTGFDVAPLPMQHCVPTCVGSARLLLLAGVSVTAAVTESTSTL